MSIPGAGSPLFLSAAAAEAAAAHQIDRSLRFERADDAYLSRTFSAGNRKTWTFSCWAKLSEVGTNRELFCTPGANPWITLQIASNNKFAVYWTAGQAGTPWTSDALFRDPSAWYHFVVAWDTTQSTASNRLKVYANGVQLTGSNNYPDYNTDYQVNSAVSHGIGGNKDELGGYLAEIHFVDGQALAASDFGEYDSNNVWQPKQFTGTHNTAGGTVYSSQTITNENSGYTTDKMFDGVYGSSASLDNSVIANQTDGTYSVYTFASPISYSSSVRIYGDLDTRSTDPDIKANSTSVTGFSDNTGTGGNNKKWYSVLSGSGTLSTVSLNQYSGYVAAIYAIEVDGTVLVDGTTAGVNGFYLKFADNSSNAALGTDSSGNSNTWTVNNLSVASGSGNDSLIDTPTNYTPNSGNPGGNYATFSPIDSHSSNTFSQGNLEATNAGTSVFANLTMGFTSGKWYCEIEADGGGSGSCMVGIVDLNKTHAQRAYGNAGGFYMYQGTGGLYSGGLGGSFSNGSYGSAYSDGDIIGIGLDMDNGNVRFYINGSDQGQANTSSLAGALVSPAVNNDTNSATFKLNTGQRAFSYTPPTGHKAMCTTNFADPTIADGSTAFDIVNETTSVAGSAKVISGLGFGPDLVISKLRNQSSNGRWGFIDTVRGVNKTLASDRSDAEVASQSDLLTQFNSDGFNIGADAAGYGWNYQNTGSLYTYWAWDGGTSTVSNTDGSITSNVRASQTNGFSIVSYTGNSTSGATVGHGLNAKPECIILKSRTATESWFVNFPFGTGTGYLMLHDTAAADSPNSSVWNSTDPTSSVFTLGNSSGVNGSQNYIAYCWAPVAGYSSFGSYVGNGSSSGPFVFTGFRPALVICKASSTTSSWNMFDSTRAPYNVVKAGLLLDSANAEFSSSDRIDILSNGFKVRSGTAEPNASGVSYVYMAWAEHPFATSRAR